MDLILVSGLSGSGKSVALAMLEDLDWYTLDNIPVRLLPGVLEELTRAPDAKFERLAIGLDSRPRGEDLRRLETLLPSLKNSGVNCQLVYLHASDEALMQRYLETRRRHPQSMASAGGRRLEEAIRYERELLAPLAESADLVLDTSDTGVHELREIVRERVARHPRQTVSLQLESFGFRYGVPANADFVFDARFLPNPYWEKTLRPLTGLDPAIREYLDGFPEVQRYIDDLVSFLERWLPGIEAANRSYLTVAVGCTGGRHRSVYITEQLAARLSERYPDATLRHSALPAAADPDSGGSG
ncbi:MAG: RNase adapter RapZ [Gammaproteobacteria bacterium]